DRRVVTRRRKRYRYRLRRLTPVALVVVAAGFGGAWVGSHQTATPLAAAALPPLRVPQTHQAAKHAAKHARGAPEQLLVGGSLVTHRFSPAILGASAVLVDAKTGRVLWAKRPHERRHIASTTKIMTALLALQKLKPHQVLTVDRSVPKVPLVREGLRAGERVQAWKLFYSLLLYSGNDDALELAIASSGDDD